MLAVSHSITQIAGMIQGARLPIKPIKYEAGESAGKVKDCGPAEFSDLSDYGQTQSPSTGVLPGTPPSSFSFQPTE